VLEDGYREDLDLDAGIDLALQGLAAMADDLGAEQVELATVDVESRAFRNLETDEVESYLAELEMGGDDE